MANIDRVDAQIAVNGAFAQAEAFVARQLSDFTPDQVDEVAQVVAELGQAFALNRLSYLAQVAADYPERKRGGGGRKPTGGSGKPFGGGSGGTGITTAQRNLIERLLEEKEGASDVFDGNFDGLDKKSASTTIESLIGLPDID